MKVIRTKADVQSLKDDECLPIFYIDEIYHLFLGLYEAENNGEEIEVFSLPAYACIYHFNDEEDWRVLEKLMPHIEYVDTEIVDGCKYFRIGIMQDHQISIIFLLEGTLPGKTEQWLEN